MLVIGSKVYGQRGVYDAGLWGLRPEHLIDGRLFGNNFDTVLKGEDLLTATEGVEPGIVGLFSGLESQSELSQLLEQLFGLSPSEQSS